MHGFCAILLVTRMGDCSPVWAFCLLVCQRENCNNCESYIHDNSQVIQNCGDKQDFLSNGHILFVAAFLSALYPFMHCFHLLVLY